MSQTFEPIRDSPLTYSTATSTKCEIRSRIEQVGVVPTIRARSAKDAVYAAETLVAAGIPAVEISMTVPGALDVVAHLAKHGSEIIVGAGGLHDTDTALRCLDAGAKFLVGDALVPRLLALAAEQDAVAVQTAMTPTEIITALRAGADFVKAFPCDALGGHRYMRTLKSTFPDLPIIAAGGVTQQTAFDFVAAGATALDPGEDLVPQDAIEWRQSARIGELARRFLSSVRNGRISAESLSSYSIPA